MSVRARDGGGRFGSRRLGLKLGEWFCPVGLRLGLETIGEQMGDDVAESVGSNVLCSHLHRGLVLERQTDRHSVEPHDPR